MDLGLLTHFIQVLMEEFKTFRDNINDKLNKILENQEGLQLQLNLMQKDADSKYSSVCQLIDAFRQDFKLHTFDDAAKVKFYLIIC